MANPADEQWLVDVGDADVATLLIPPTPTRERRLDAAGRPDGQCAADGSAAWHATTAAACGRLGRKEEARAALVALRSLLPGYRDELGPALGLWILDEAVVEQVMEGLAQAEAL